MKDFSTLLNFRDFFHTKWKEKKYVEFIMLIQSILELKKKYLKQTNYHLKAIIFQTVKSALYISDMKIHCCVYLVKLIPIYY